MGTDQTTPRDEREGTEREMKEKGKERDRNIGVKKSAVAGESKGSQ